MASSSTPSVAVRADAQAVAASAPPQQRKPQRLSHLDGLRGIAALLVAVQHTVTVLAHLPGAPQWYQALAWAGNTTYFSPGRTGVVTFFLISGFVVPFSLKEPKALRSFAVSRFFRLYPAYWFSLLLAVPLFAGLGIADLTAKQVVTNITMVQFALRQPDVVGAYWTLFIELAFYACAALWFIMGFLRSERFLVAVIVSLLALALMTAAIRYVHPQAALPVGYVAFLATMHLGTLARLALLEGNVLARKLLAPTVAVVLSCAIAIHWLAYSESPEVDPWIAGITGLFAGYALFFYCVFTKAFANRVTLFLGGISYSYYLLHGIFLHVGEKFAAGMTWSVGALTVVLFTVPLSMIVSALVFQYVEKPSIRLGHAIMRRLHARQIA